MTENSTNRKVPPFRLILFALVILVFIIYLVNSNNDKKMLQEGQATAELISKNEKNKKIEDFVSFVEDRNNEMSPGHTYTNEALVKLSEAINSTAGVNGYEIHEDLEKVRALAADITKDSLSTTHANTIRNAADILTDALQELQREQYPELNLEVNDLRNACVSINPKERTLRQKDAIKGFFNKAANLLKKMN
jgi:hypothetical protein